MTSLIRSSFSCVSGLTRQLTTLSLRENVITTPLVSRCTTRQHTPPAGRVDAKPRLLHTAAWTQYRPTETHCNPLRVDTRNRPLLQAASKLPTSVIPVRTRIRYALKDGKARTVKAVTKRFFRLHNGMWIRPRAGRFKKRWKKDARRVSQAQYHVFCTQRQCWTLDKMVNRFYKEATYYPNDPYQHYHRRQNLPHFKYQPPRFLP